MFFAIWGLVRLAGVIVLVRQKRERIEATTDPTTHLQADSNTGRTSEP